MVRKLRTVVCSLVVAAAVSSTASATPLTFSAFVNPTGGQPIGFAYAGNKFVGSNYFNNQLYQTDLNGGSLVAFGTPLPIASGSIGEIYVSSSLGLGGFGSSSSREVFAGSESLGTVYKFNNDGSGQVAFVSGLVGGVRSIAFDPYGLYGYDMIVATSTGRVYQVDSAGVATLLTNTGEDTEGLSFAPQPFGSVPAGALVVASEGSGKLRAVDPSGTQTLVTTIPSAEMVSFVPLNLGLSGNPLEGFYAANFDVDVIKAGASEFLSYIGDMIVTGETTHQVWDVKWDPTSSSFISTVIGTFPNQPEDGIFVTEAILNPGGTVPEPASLLLFGTGIAALARRRIRKRS